MKVLADDRTAALSYSALDRLHDFCSADTSWTLLTRRDLQALDDVDSPRSMASSPARAGTAVDEAIGGFFG